MTNKQLWFILGLIVIGEASFTGLLPISRGHLFELLTAKAGPIWAALILYFLVYLAIDFFQSIKDYWVLKTSLWYRDNRTRQVKRQVAQICMWNKKQEHPTLPTNTPQRIQEDIKLSYLQRITVWVEYVISGLILIQLFFLNLNEPTLIVLAISYAAISVLIALKFNPRLTQAEISVQQAEANYRTGLVSNILDISGQNIANRACLASKWIQTEYLLFTKLQLGLVAVVPYALLLPKLLHGTLSLGQVVAHQATFALIVVNASILIQKYTTLIQGRASEIRVKEIEK